MRRFLIAGPASESEASRAWPWLGWIPRPWRAAAERWARPRFGLALATSDGGVEGHYLSVPSHYGREKLALNLGRLAADLLPETLGWTGRDPPPAVPGASWRTGRLFALLAGVVPLCSSRDRFAGAIEEGVLLIGGRMQEAAAAARLLAGMVDRLILVSPAEHFRNRLAWQIMTETGLAMITRAEIPEGGWGLALDLRPGLPVLFQREGPPLHPHPAFAEPWRILVEEPFGQIEHPACAECQLSCLAPRQWTPLPARPTLAGIKSGVALAGRIGLTFALLDKAWGSEYNSFAAKQTPRGQSPRF